MASTILSLLPHLNGVQDFSVVPKHRPFPPVKLSAYFLYQFSDFVPIDCAGLITKVCPSTLIDGTPYSKRLYITNIKLTSILHVGQFPDIKVILKRWKEKGILKSEKDRYISDIHIVKNMPTVKGYMINMPEQEGQQ